MERTAYFEVADADGYIFSNCKYEDLIVYTDAPSQAIHIGNTVGGVSAFMIRQNDVNVLRNISVGKSNPDYPLDVLGNAAIDGSLLSTKYIVSRGMQVKRRLAGSFSNPALPSGVVAGFSNDRDGVVISINSNSASNYIRFMASNTQVLDINGQGLLTVSGSIMPRAAQEYNLGAMTSRFNEAYFNALTLGTLRISSDNNAITLPTTIVSPSLTLSNGPSITTLFTSNSFLGISRSNPTEALDIVGNIKVSSNAAVMSRIGIATSNPIVSLEINTTDAVLLPRGTTGQRPGAPAQGHIRYNTTLSTFEGYGPGNTWGSLGGGVKDTNQDTYITPELVPNDDTLRFYNSNVETLRLRLSNLEVRVPATFTRTTTLLPVSISPIVAYPPPSYNATTSNFTISGQSYGNGAYSILGSTLFNSFTTYQAAFDQDIMGRWMSAQTFNGPGRTYNSTQVTTAVTGSNYPGEWLQITLPNSIVPTRLRMITGINNATYAVDTFTLLGSSNNGSTWKPFFSSLGNSGWPTSANSNLAFNYSINETDTFTTYRLVFFKSYSDLIYVNYVAIDGYVPAPPIPPKLGVGLSNPTEDVDIIGNLRTSSNAYILNRVSIAHSNPVEALDIHGNVKVSQTLYAMASLGVGMSNPSELLDISGSLKASSNVYAMSRIGIALSNPEEALHIQGNFKATSNIYSMVSLGVATSNPTEAIDIVGNVKTSSNMYVSGSAAIGHSNPVERLDIQGNIRSSSNVYALSRLGVGTSNPSESIEVVGNIRASSNIYAIASMSIGNSNPTEALDVSGNVKANSAYVLSNLGIGTSNPVVPLDVNGDVKVNSNLEVIGNLTIRGITTTVDSTTVTIRDNIIRLNNGASFNSSLQAGIEINRGSGNSNYMLIFDEPTNYFKIGQQGQLQTVATRDDNPNANTLMIYDATQKKLTACNNLVYTNNNLGIGLTNPQVPLHVQSSGTNTAARITNGTVEFSITPGTRFGTTSSSWATLDVNGAVGTTGIALWDNFAVQNGLSVGADSTYGQATPPTAGAIIEGSVGIATTNPRERLHIATGKLLVSSNQILAYAGDTSGVPSYSWSDNSNTGIYHPANNTIAFTNNGVETVRISPSGNVGIGTSNPSVNLDIVGTVNATTIQQNGTALNTMLSGYATSTSVANAISKTNAWTDRGGGNNFSAPQVRIWNDQMLSFHSATDYMYIQPNTSGQIEVKNAAGTLITRFSTSEVVFGVPPQLSSGMNVQLNQVVHFGVGYSKDVSAGKIGYNTFSNYALDIVGAGGTPRWVRIWDRLESGLINADGYGLRGAGAFYNVVGMFYQTDMLYVRNSAANVWAALTVNSNTWTQSSDVKLKSDIVDLANSLSIIMQLRPVSFIWKHMLNEPQKPKRCYGLIAQEVQNVIPDIVSCMGEKDDVTLGVDYTSLIPHLISCIQTLSNKVDVLQARIDELTRQ